MSGNGSADLCFQSIAGSEKAMSAFGVTTGMLEEANALFKDRGHAKGPNVMYFETGQQDKGQNYLHLHLLEVISRLWRVDVMGLQDIINHS